MELKPQRDQERQARGHRDRYDHQQKGVFYRLEKIRIVEYIGIVVRPAPKYVWDAKL